MAARAALKGGRVEQALGHLDHVTNHRSEIGREALRLRVEACWLLGQASGMEQACGELLEIDRRDATAHRPLAMLLTLESRRREAARHHYLLLQQGEISLEELAQLTDEQSLFGVQGEIDRLLKSTPTDPLPRLALGRIALARKEYSQAEVEFRAVLARYPGQLDALAWLGHALIEAERWDSVAEWHKALPPESDDHAQVWMARGAWAMHRGETRAAMRCFWEAANRDPNLYAAHFELSVLLGREGRDEEGKLFQTRAEQLLDLQSRMSLFHPNKGDLAKRLDAPQQLSRIARTLESLHRPLEAKAWQRVADGLRTGHRTDLALDRIDVTDLENLPRTLPAGCLAAQVDLSDHELPEWDGRQTTRELPNAPPGTDQFTAVRFEDSTAEANLSFTYFNGADAARTWIKLHESTGGGVAILDFDADGWPDIYLTQGCEWPPVGQSPYLDRLFRHNGRNAYRDVTLVSGMGDERYSQGVSAGDFNNDGFTDLYLANIGENRLYRNNGDGTVSDVTTESGITHAGWTTSCMIADVNGDSWPDLYDVRYLRDADALSRDCPAEGRMVGCSPLLFETEPDLLWISQGDGRFVEQSLLAGIDDANGNGLGIVAGDFDGSGRLSLFVANDQKPNFLFVNRNDARGDRPKFVQEGTIAGVAVDEHGRAQASMGIAVDDANEDGRLDLFVTNFLGEANTLYLQTAMPLRFADQSRNAGLHAPSLPYLGFGTQFIDGELDGRPDLIVANGHVDDVRFRGEAFRMRPQYFRNQGQGRFVELSAESLGPFFLGEYLGRSLARLDWNRDGREDVVISHLDTPATLLTNRTQTSFHHLAVHLKGRASERDAIGAIVTADIGGRAITRQLTAGDGYMTSNQRRLVFGLGPDDKVDCLTVRWPSGMQQSYRDVAANQELIIVEGSDQAFRMPPP